MKQDIDPSRNYFHVITQALNKKDALPSLPAIVFDIRRALVDNDTTNIQLANLVKQDVGLTALLLKTASSPLYRTSVPAVSIKQVIARLGMKTVGHLVFVHSLKGMFNLKSTSLEPLFNYVSKRQSCMAGLSTYLAMKLLYPYTDQVMIASILSEVGNLAILVAFKDSSYILEPKIYFALCRKYGKSIGTVLLNRWKIDQEIIDALKGYGKWKQTDHENLCLVDILNLAKYHTAFLIKKDPVLPPLSELAAFIHIPPDLNETKDGMELLLVADHRDLILEIIDGL